MLKRGFFFTDALFWSLALALALGTVACAEVTSQSGSEPDLLDVGPRELPEAFPDPPDAVDDTGQSLSEDASLTDVVADVDGGDPGDTQPADDPRPQSDVTTSDTQPNGDPLEPEVVDPCDRTDACPNPVAGTRCDENELVVCFQDSQGCFIEQRVDCGEAGDECVVNGSVAQCQPTSSPPPPAVEGGDTCTDPIPVTAGVYAFNTADYSSDYSDFSACGSILDDIDGPEVVLSITLDSGQSVTASMESSDSDFDVVAAISDSCTNLTGACLAYSDESIFLYPEVVTVTNSTASAHEYFIIGGGDWDDDSGPLSVTITVSP